MGRKGSAVTTGRHERDPSPDDGAGLFPDLGGICVNAHFIIIHSVVRFSFFCLLYVLFYNENDLKSKAQTIPSVSPCVLNN